MPCIFVDIHCIGRDFNASHSIYSYKSLICSMKKLLPGIPSFFIFYLPLNFIWTQLLTRYCHSSHPLSKTILLCMSFFRSSFLSFSLALFLFLETLIVHSQSHKEIKLGRYFLIRFIIYIFLGIFFPAFLQFQWCFSSELIEEQVYEKERNEMKKNRSGAIAIRRSVEPLVARQHSMKRYDLIANISSRRFLSPNFNLSFRCAHNKKVIPIAHSSEEESERKKKHWCNIFL